MLVIRNVGQWWAVEALCPHRWFSLAAGVVWGQEIECPVHRARFHLHTGRAMYGPTRRPLRICPVRQLGLDLFMELPLRYG